MVFGLSFSPVLGLALIADFSTVSDSGRSALRAKSDVGCEVAGFDSVFVTSFAPVGLEACCLSGVVRIGSVRQDGRLEVLTAFEFFKGEEAFRSFRLESGGLEFVVDGDAKAGAVWLVAVALGFDHLERFHIFKQ